VRSARVRFLFEAGFLIAVAAAAGALQLEPVAIVAVMVVAWLATALFERGAAAQGPAVRTARRPAEKRRRGHGSRGGRPVPREAPIDALLAPTAPHVEVVEPEAPPEPTPEEPPPTEPVPPQPEPTEPEPIPSVDTTSLPKTADQPPRPPLVAVPPPERAETPVREPEPSTAAARRVVTLEPRRGRPRAWNLWELERVVRERAGENAARDEERNYLLVCLRQFARPDGELAVEFDDVVQESFGDLLVSPSR
jgi:hypothetical protein